jgi:hypothetical protein
MRLYSNQLGEEHIAFFRQQGFLALENVASAAEVAELRTTLEQLMSCNAGSKEGAFFDFVGDTPMAIDALTQMLMPSNYAPQLRRTVYHRRLKTLAKQLLGPRARFAGDHVFFKPPTTGPATPWHQDEAFRDPDFDYQEVSFWLPLQPVTLENGCLRFIPGSHLHGVNPHRKLPGKERSHGIECCAGFSEDDAVACPLPVGGCTVHGGRTLHGAGPNHSAAPRFAYVVGFDVPRVVGRHRRAFDWQKQASLREETERNWKKGPGRVTHLYRRLRQLNFLDPYRLYHGLRRCGWRWLQRFAYRKRRA